MSVINQMLKDLDKRQIQQQQATPTIMAVRPVTSKFKITLTVLVIALLLNAVVFFTWQLYSENQSLKSQVSAQVSPQEGNEKPSVVIEPATLLKKSIVSRQVLPVVADESSEQTTPTSLRSSERQSSITINKQSPSVVSERGRHNLDVVSKPENIAPSVTKHTKQGQEREIESGNVAAVITTPTLTISRRKISPQALVKNKITAAEQALENSEIAKAETLFADVLLVMPEHQSARKQLAALWYGKKSYQNALNLLAQGIAIEPQEPKMRLMSARIYLQQGLYQAAMKMLKPIATLPDIETQSLLATTAGQLADHNSAINAYEILIQLKPATGRWWLGLAVSYDSQGKFANASHAYQQALARENLSDSSAKFARQRVSELGE